MARSPLASFLRRLHADHRTAEEAGLPVDEIRGMRAEAKAKQALSRRDFLVGAGLAVGAATLAPRQGWAGKGGGGGSSNKRVAIVGGGIAGLTAGLKLLDAGFTNFTIYEASTVRAGGRMMSSGGDHSSTCGKCHSPRGSSNQTPFLDGQVVDVFGELIDTNHTTIQALAARFGLTLTDLLAGEPTGTTDTYHFQGGYYPAAQADADYLTVYPALQADLRRAGYPTTFAKSTADGRALDAMSVYDYIETRVPGGHASRFGRLLDAAYNIEYGAETTDQSALGLLYMLGYSPKSRFSVFGESDERFHVKGGVQQIPDAIAASLGYGNKIQLGCSLTALAKNADGTYTLSFDGKPAVVADVVLLAVPFSILREIDYSRAGFDALKTTAIQTQGQGHNGKLQLQFESRLWNQQGAWGRGNGNVYTDLGFQVAWEVTRGEPGARGILADYTGGNVTNSLAQGHPVALYGDFNLQADCNWFLNRLETVFPGISAKWNGRAVGSVAHKSKFFKTSYCYWAKGQYSQFCGYERVPQGNVFFAGEHTSVDFGGFMEGAASEGTRAASEILAVR